jgi:hypothetical protein
VRCTILSFCVGKEFVAPLKFMEVKPDLPARMEAINECQGQHDQIDSDGHGSTYKVRRKGGIGPWALCSLRRC